jgi:hypothetical protein
VKLYDKAIELCNIYKLNSKVDAAFIGGSVSRDWQDAYSDIEIFVLWESAPTDADRTRPIKAQDGRIIDFFPYEEEEWSETYISQGVKLEISNFLTSTIDKLLDDVVLAFDTDLNKQCLAASVLDGIAGSDNQILQTLKAKVHTYPDELRVAMIRDNMDLGTKWNNREALLQRQDWLMLYQMIAEVQTKLMGMLFGLNKQYVHHPAYKWQQHSLALMPLAPVHIAARFESVFLNDPRAGISELEAITEEIYCLVEQQLPEMDLAEVRIRSLFLRPKNT